MAARNNSSSFSIGKLPSDIRSGGGNCKVVVEGGNFVSERRPGQLAVSVTDVAKINVSVASHKEKRWSKKSCMDFLTRIAAEDSDESFSYSKNSSFLLLNPKEIDSHCKPLIQDVLALYKKELPTMNYAANTGRKSLFLERCVSNGKYCTLIVRSNASGGLKEVIAAISFQIASVDSQYAEIPLAAVSSSFQRKGFGHYVFEELKKRLESVGVLTIFCWADKESEGFWLKQGFVPIAKVNSKGRAGKLPIKAEIRKTLCIPGGSTLMVTHLKKNMSIFMMHPLNAEEHPSNPKETLNSPCPGIVIRSRDCSSIPPTEGAKDNVIISNIRPLPCQPETNLFDEKKNDGIHGEMRLCCDAAINFCSCASQNMKRKVWEASWSSIKSKKVKGSHHDDCDMVSGGSLPDDSNQQTFIEYDHGCLKCSRDEAAVKVLSENTSNIYYEEKQDGDNKLGTNDHLHPTKPILSQTPVIMLMNIADDMKKAGLIKIIKDLGGSVSSTGSSSTHIITKNTRRTLNFCIALCSGAWIVSPEWLKASFKEGAFVDETSFILDDEEYKVKYKSELNDAVLRAKERPYALLKGYDVYLAANVQPPAKLLAAIVQTAGGNVLGRHEKAKNPAKTILVTCEEDVEAAMEASKRGIWVYSSDWFMSCIMRQKLDFNAPQFAESL